MRYWDASAIVPLLVEEARMNEVRTACRLLRVHPLRAADAMQLAAATVMAGGRTLQAGFLAFDDRLREAAGREEFVVGP